MGRSLPFVMALFLGTMLASPAATSANAQEKAKMDRVTGTVTKILKDTKTILIDHGAGEASIQVVYDDNTKFTKNNKAASLDDLETGRRVICVGTRNKDGQVMATHIDIRPMS
jgi:Domain of unknown function (DUF5666)